MFPWDLTCFHSVATGELYFWEQSSNLYWLSVMYLWVDGQQVPRGIKTAVTKGSGYSSRPVPLPPWRNLASSSGSMCLKQSDGFAHENSHLCGQPNASALVNQLTRYCSLVLLSQLSDWIFLVACWSWVVLTHRNHHWEHLFSTWCSLISDPLKPANEGVLTNDDSSPKKGLVVRYLLVHPWSYPTDPISPDLMGH